MRATHFPNGLNNAARNSTLYAMGQLDPTTFHTFFNDFDTYVAADWIVIETGNATQALGAADGGTLVVTNAAADNDACFMQNAIASFLLSATKKSFFKCRFKVSDATQSDFQLGLIITDTTPLDATDGIYFQKDDGDAQLDVYVRKNATTGSTSTTNIATVVDDTYLSVGWYYDAAGNVQVFVNDALTYTFSSISDYFPDGLLNVSFGIVNGEAVAKLMTVDYIFAAQER